MKKLNVIYGALFFILMFSMCSCSARKSALNKSQEQTQSNVTDNSSTKNTQDTNVKTTTTVKVDDKNQTFVEETVLEPADSSKESFVIEKDGTKVILNNAKKIVRKTVKNNNTASISNTNMQEAKKEATHEQKNIFVKETSKKEIKSKETERKATPWYYWLLLLFPFVFLFAVFKRYGIF